MARTKIIDVTLATMRNVGPEAVSPKGVLRCAIVRAVNDEEIHQVELLYERLESGQPMHPSGARNIPPGQGLTYNVTKRLTVTHNDESDGVLNEMLMFSSDLTEDVVELGTVHPDEIYQGSFNRKIRFEEINGFNAVTCDYRVTFRGEERAVINVDYTVSLISG